MLSTHESKIQLELMPPTPEIAEKKGNGQGQVLDGQGRKPVQPDGGRRGPSATFHF